MVPTKILGDYQTMPKASRDLISLLGMLLNPLGKSLASQITGFH